MNSTTRATLSRAAGAIAAMLAFAPAAADPRNPYQLPEQFDRAVCYWVAQQVGRTIAWARWEQHYTEAKTRAVGFGQGTPAWVTEVVGDWITDAYAWQPTDEQVRVWAEELGDVAEVPHANQLTRDQTIAVWMRRIGRDCDAREAGA